MKRETTSVEINGHTITFETGKIARQAGGAIIVRCGDTMAMATACRSPEPLADVDFLPLRVDYQEKFASTGKTVSGFIKREGKPTQNEILVSRLIDRPIRPMFVDGYYHDVQLFASVLSYDSVHNPDVLSICASSAALCISDIPLIKPIGAVRVGVIDGKFVVNPTVDEQKRSRLDLVMAGTENAVLMIEGSADFLTEEETLQAIEIGHHAIQKICKALHDLQNKVGKPKKTDTIKQIDPAIIDAIHRLGGQKFPEALRIREKTKHEQAVSEIKKEILETLSGETASPRYDAADVKKALKQYSSDVMRKMILDEGIRCDGRNLTTIRPIDIEQALLPRTHGSSLFTRGETQSLAICVLGPESMSQRYEDLNVEKTPREVVIRER